MSVGGTPYNRSCFILEKRFSKSRVVRRGFIETGIFSIGIGSNPFNAREVENEIFDYEIRREKRNVTPVCIPITLPYCDHKDAQSHG